MADNMDDTRERKSDLLIGGEIFVFRGNADVYLGSKMPLEIKEDVMVVSLIGRKIPKHANAVFIIQACSFADGQ